MDNSILAEAPAAAKQEEHFVTIRITTEDVPDLKKIMTAAQRLGTVRGVSYDKY